MGEEQTFESVCNQFAELHSAGICDRVIFFDAIACASLVELNNAPINSQGFFI
jgi:hypothetical protein